MKNLKQSLADAGWEMVDPTGYAEYKVMEIQRIYKVEKQEWNLRLCAVGELDLINEDYKLTPTQAEKVAEALEAVMKHLQYKGVDNTSIDVMLDRIFAAREALRSTE